MKKVLAYIVCIALILALTGCGAEGAAQVVNDTGSDAAADGTVTDYSGSTVTGRVTAIEGGSVTLQLGTLTSAAPGGDNGGGSDTSGETATDKDFSGSSHEPPSSEGGTPPDMPSGGGAQQEPPSGSGGTPPDMPSGGDAANDDTDAQTEATPDADGDSSTPPDMPSGSGMGGTTFTAGDDSVTVDLTDSDIVLASGDAGSISDISEGDVLSVEFGDGNAVLTATVEKLSSGGPSGSMGSGTGSISGGVDSYDAVNSYTTDTEVSGTELSSTGTDENAVLVSDGAKVTLDNVTITRDSDSSTGGDNSSFYGVGAAALITDGILTVSNSVIDSDASGGAGVFAYGDGTAYVSDTSITTNKGTSGGIHVAGGGTLYAWDLDVETNGASSAAIRSDRGSGTMVVDGGSYTSNGSGSPAVYSTADITVNGASLTATGSESVCIEGFNSVRLFDCDLSGNMPGDNTQNDCVWNVILYQSMSGDSKEGNSTFEMTGGTLTAKNGGMFYTTNTESTFILSGVNLVYSADNDFFLKCTGNSNARGWGSTGANGADCVFSAIGQAMSGDIIYDSISKLDFYMLEGSTLTGALIDDESNAGSGGDGYAALYIDAGSTWIVTGDSTLTTLNCAGSIVDANGRTVSIAGGDGTVYVSGTSAYTVTVNAYSTTVDASGASSVDSWDSFAVTK